MSNEVEKMLTAIVTILLGIIGVATLTAIVSNQSQSPQVIGAAAGGFACALRTAITGNNECGGSTPFVNSNITFGNPIGSPTAGGSCFTSRGCN
jgi:hypothetical protein